MKNSKTNKENLENQEKSNKQESLIKNSDSNAINNKTVREWRDMKVNKEKVKSVVKKAVVLIAASLTTISLFACGGKTETKMEYPSISIDQDANLSNGNKINSKEVVVGGNNGKSTNNNENNLLNNDKWYVKDGITYSRATGKPRTIQETIGDLEIVKQESRQTKYGEITEVNIIDKKGNSWEVAIAPDLQVSVLKDKDGRETLIGSTNETAEQLIAQANMMDNVSRSMGQID